MARCPRCEREVKKIVKEYELNQNMHVKMYECCGKFQEWSIKKNKIV